MAREVVWSGPAWKDLTSACDYIAQESPSAAAALFVRVIEAARSLESFADRGRRIAGSLDLAKRELLVSPYWLRYRVAETTVEILSLFHSARSQQET